MNNINKYIDEIAEKFDYDEELTCQLKRIVPAMLEDKSEEAQQLLFDTLRRVKIFVMEDIFTKEDVENCKKEIMGEDNKDVTFVQEKRGKYDDMGVASGAYINEPVFDKDMNIVDRKGFIYVSKLPNNIEISKVYGTRINLSHLIHELGHAWASEKEEFVQDKDGNFVTKVGAYVSKSEVNKEKREVSVKTYEGLMIEEALNTIEEENTVCKVLNIEDIREISLKKGYSMSSYQGAMTDMMRAYAQKFGKERFDSYRIFKNGKALEEVEKVIEETDGFHVIKTEEYTKKKKAKFSRINDLETTEGAKQNINEVVEKYSKDFFPDNTKFTPMQKLENVYRQIYDFSVARYNFDILQDCNGKMQRNEHNLGIYKEVMGAILEEGYVLKNQAKELPEKEEKTNDFIASLKNDIKSDKEMEKEINNKTAENRYVQKEDIKER